MRSPRAYAALVFILGGVATCSLAQDLCEFGTSAKAFNEKFPWYATRLRNYQQCFGEEKSSLANDLAACNFFVARVLEANGVKGLRYADGQLMTADDLGAEFKRRSQGGPGDVQLLGFAKDRAALDAAGGAANSRKMVVAVGMGHIALVLPGAPTHSQSWGLDVPPAASWFIHQPERIFVGCPLSKAWHRPDNIYLYAF